MTNFAGVSGQQLRQLIERIERLEEEKATLATDIREVYGEAKSHGFDTKILRKVIGLRKMDQDERAEYEEMLTVYMHALDMASKPMFKPSVQPDDALESDLEEDEAA